MPLVVAIPAVQFTLLGAGLFLAPGWGAAALASYLAQPYLAIGGTGLRPRDLTPIGALTRPFRGAWGAIRTAMARTEAEVTLPVTPTAGERAGEYIELLAGGLDRFFEPRRQTCPLCHGASLSVRVRVDDLLQFKPGRFELDECATCGHIFQNPRLSLEGLDFYYRDFYDGIGGEQSEFVFSSDDSSYRGRVDLVAAHARPKRWLDVGAGHGHFCLVASDVLPDTRFEGLDLSDSIVGAEQRQWIDRAHVGMFPELSDDLLETYDVVSMHHYLEHTRDPAEELAAAAKVLESGGHLLIEVPDPECTYGRILGWTWGPWFQPQHQHFVSAGNLATMLTDRGFTVVAQERGPAHQPVDLAFAVMHLANRIAGPPSRPWLRSPRLRARVRRGVGFSAVVPFMVAALIVDRLIAPVIRRLPGGSNTYRMLARKN
jgi:SAM-dependent methyltransferase